MRFKLLGRLAGIAGLGLTLSACVDVNIDVALTSATTARAAMTQTLSADIYAMASSAADGIQEQDDAFCSDGMLTENADGSATCTLVEEGNFADLDLGQDEGGVTFADAGDGLVRLTLPTASMTADLGIDEEMDEDTRQLVLAFFEGRTITVTFAGAEVLDTNMTRSADGKSANQVIPFLDLINGTLDVPAELYAVVRAP